MSLPRIVFLERDTVTAGDMDFSGIESLGDVTYCGNGNTDWAPGAFPAPLRDAEILILNKTKITRTFLAECPSLRCVCLLATGYNNIDPDAVRERGVAVCNVPGYSTDAVAQLTFGLLLQLAGSLPQYEASVREGMWCASSRYTYLSWPITELAGKTLGVVGYGTIGRKVAQIGRAFGMRVLAHTRTVPSNASDVTFCSLEDLLRQADVLTLHCPLTPHTKGLLGKDRLALMKPTAFLLNTSRGGVVDEQALADALNAGRLAGAGIDVLETEPMPRDCPYRTAKNCLVTPHVAWAARESRARLLGEVERNIRAFLSGAPRNRVL